MEIIGKYILDSKDSDYNNDIDTINFEEDGTFIFFYKDDNAINIGVIVINIYIGK